MAVPWSCHFWCPNSNSEGRSDMVGDGRRTDSDSDGAHGSEDLWELEPVETKKCLARLTPQRRAWLYETLGDGSRHGRSGMKCQTRRKPVGDQSSLFCFVCDFGVSLCLLPFLLEDYGRLSTAKCSSHLVPSVFDGCLPDGPYYSKGALAFE